MNPFKPVKKLSLFTEHSEKLVISVFNDQNLFKSHYGLPRFFSNGSFTLKQAYEDTYSDSIAISGKVKKTPNGTHVDIELRYEGEMYIGYYACVCGLILSLFYLNKILGVILLPLTSTLILIMVLYQQLLLRMKSKEIENQINSQLRQRSRQAKLT